MEADRIGGGATGHSAGHVLGGFLASPDEMIANVGAKRTFALQALSHAGKLALGRFVSNDPALQAKMRPGYLLTALTGEHVETLASTLRYWHHELKLDGGLLLAADQLHDFVRSPLFRLGLYDPSGFSIDPVSLTSALQRAVLASGSCRVFEKTQAWAIDVSPANSQIEITTARGKIVARRAVLCTGAVGDIGWNKVDRGSTCTSGVLVSEKLDSSLLDEVFPARVSGSDWRPDADFFSVTSDDRVLFGGEFPLGESAPLVLEERLAAVFPRLKGVAISHRWSAPIDLTADALPMFCFEGPTIIKVGGYNGIGLAIGFALGLRAARWAAGGEFEALDELLFGNN